MCFNFRKHPLAGLFALALLAPAYAAADSSTRVVGPQPDGSVVVSDNQTLTPAGTRVLLGSPVVSKALAINPNLATNTAAVLTMTGGQPIEVINIKTGQVIQRYVPYTLSGGTYTANTEGSDIGVTYTPDGSKLLFSQDNNFVSVANVDPVSGLLTPDYTVQLPALPGSPFTTLAQCGIFYSSTCAVNLTATGYLGTNNPGGLAVTADNSTALVSFNTTNQVGIYDLTQSPAVLKSTVAVGNVPNSIVIKGNFAFVSNEGGRPATSADFTNVSSGANVVADPTDAFATTGTVSVINLATGKLVSNINVGLHPAGMFLSGSLLYVANSYSDSISVIDTGSKQVVRTISVAVPTKTKTFGAGPNALTVVGTTAYVTLGQSNAIAVVDLAGAEANPVTGYIPTDYFPTGIAYDARLKVLVVNNDKGIGAQSTVVADHGVTAYNTHEETATVSVIALPSTTELAVYTKQVMANNHWTNNPNAVLSAPNTSAAPVAIPANIGEPSLIKHVFLIIKENRTYDQILGDVAQGNGEADLAVFAAATPNQHALVKQFPLLDNVYAPSRQSADGHPWVVESGSFYSNDILSPDWVRSYPGGNSNDALTYTPKGFLWSQAEKKGMNVKMYGEWSGGYVIAPKSATSSYSWADFYNTSLCIEATAAGNNCAGAGTSTGAMIVPPNSDTESSTVPSVTAILDPHYPSFNLGIPDQYRMDYYLPILKTQDSNNAVPALTIMWLPNDHTNGSGSSTTPIPTAYQADNDLALGRLVEGISHTNAWASSAIFVVEDDSQDGVDHVDGHREPVYVISPYTVGAKTIHTTYTQENVNRTIEQILGLQPLTQFDLTAAPMTDVFTNTPTLTPFTHVPATVPLNQGTTIITGTGPANYTQNLKHSPLEKAWELASAKMTKGKEGKPDAVDENFLNHAIWYSATHYTRPYPGEAKILPPGPFVKAAATHQADNDD